VRQGSEIGNHTWEHVSLSGLSLNSDLDQISLTDSVVLGATGRWPRWVRSRAGIVDGTGMAAIGRLNHLCCRWSVEGNDTVPDFTSAQIADSVLSKAQGGSIILLHETNSKTVAALPTIIEGLQQKGLVVTTVTDMLSQ
jgi:peptidoglycan/xylan/chitin deacetylase (PgdA/CDA1 family)